MSRTDAFTAVTISGALLPADLLTSLLTGDKDTPGTSADSYGLYAGESIRRKATVAWTYLRDVWRDFARYRERTPESAWTRLTRERWLLPLLRELGYNDITVTPAGGITADGQDFPISHAWQNTPIHLLGWATDLDRRTARMAGAATAAPQSMLQQFLNRSDNHLWGLLSNGQRLRLLRDSTALTGVSYVDFDLESIFDGELFSDFVLLFLVAHATRLTPQDPEVGAASCWLEQWRAYANQLGERALQQLRLGVRAALSKIGSGLLDHPANTALRTQLADGTLSAADFNRALLRLIYRLLFWFVAEDRGVLLHHPNDSAVNDPAALQLARTARHRYTTYYSSARLRTLAIRRRHSRHHDLFTQVQLIFAALGVEAGAPALALPGLGGIFEDGPLDKPLSGALLSNTALLEAVEALAVIHSRDGVGRRNVDFRHLGAEELGGVYEGLLELHPRVDACTRSFSLESAAGNERKETGSYYTPTSLVECLLDTALDPLLDQACAHPTREQRITALLELTVCDPACGSGHFLIAAARRIARRLAAEETDELEPAPEAVRQALRQVVGRCIYGVDLNEMAAELTKVSLWLEAVEPGRPLSYLDTHIRVGNALLGTTPKLLAEGIPDRAFKPIEGDDREVTAALKKDNAIQRKAKAGNHEQLGLFTQAESATSTNRKYADEAQSLAIAEPATLADVHVQARRARDLEESLRHDRFIADAWCAAFVQPKRPENRIHALTHATFDRLTAGESTLDLADIVTMVEEAAQQYRFFHWHLEFPHIFRVPDKGVGADEATGWTGGFTCVLGNPPWERVKLQEKEFFASREPRITEAANAAARKEMIAALEGAAEPADRALFAEWVAALRVSDGISTAVRESGRYPLTATGDVNTYAVFAETARTILHPRGRLGIIVPTGIATDATTQSFFRDIVQDRSLDSLLDFVTNPRLWTDVGNRRYRFCVLSLVGKSLEVEQAEFATLTKNPIDLPPRGQRIRMTPDEILLVNPNTGTCPMFMSRRDAEITIGIYRRVPVLWRDGVPDGNSWGLSFLRMLDMANDSGHFHKAEQLAPYGWTLQGNVYERGGERMLPLYEAKLVHQFDSRLSCYSKRPEGSEDTELPRLTDEEKRDPHRVPIPRYWVEESLVEEKLAGEPEKDKRGWDRDWLFGWRDITRSTDERTLVSTVLPRVGVGHKFLLGFPHGPVPVAGLQANFSALVLDFAARQKLSGVSMGYFIVKQLPVLPPDAYTQPTPWDGDACDLNSWVTARVLELTYTAYDVEGFARDLRDDGPPFMWDPARRMLLRAELDAAYFHLYGVARDDVDYIMDTFKVTREREQSSPDGYRTKRLILERYDAMAEAIRTGKPYVTVLDPPPGHGRRHPAKG